MSRLGAAAGRIRAIALKELRHLRRDRLTGGMIAGIPVALVLLFGYGINQDVRHLRAAVADLADTQLSRRLAADTAATQVVDIVRGAASAEELEELLRRGEISIGIVIPADFESRLVRGDRAAAQLLVDGGDPIVVSTARGLVDLRLERDQMPVARPPAVRADAALPAAAPSRPVYELRPFYNPERRSPVYIVPALCGVILTLTMVLFTSTAIVRERERGNLELLIATPVRTLELMVGKILPYIVIGYVQVSLILLLGVFLFAVPIRGSLGDFYLGSGVFVAAALALGLFISTLASNQFQAFQMTIVSYLPQLLLSGFMFPFDGMPEIVQGLAEFFPLTHYIRIIRGVVLRGATLGEVWPDIWPLLTFFAVMMSLAVLRFRKRLD
ncbi:MAG: ABC transporter permease [Thermoanaerobaculia bacterium]|nr:ABC transporter permease [Thermoanaerobaculia bacterium]